MVVSKGQVRDNDLKKNPAQLTNITYYLNFITWSYGND